MRVSHHFFLTLGLFLGGLLLQPAHGQDPPQKSEEATSPADLATLLENLKSPDFQKRQKSLQQFNLLDASRLGELETLLADAGEEQVRQLQPALERLRLKAFDQVYQPFATNPQPQSMTRLPHAERFLRLAGTSDGALAVFREMLNAERKLFALQMVAPSELSVELERRSGEFSDQCNGRTDEPFPAASCLALMLLASDPEVRLIRATSTNISDALDDPRFEQLVSDGAYSEITIAIASEWLKRPGISTERPLLFCIRRKLPAGRAIAERVIQSRSRRPDMILSLLCLASLNNTDDLSLVEPLLETQSVLWPPRGQSVRDLLPEEEVESTYQVRTCDLALAVALSLRKVAPEEFGLHIEFSDEGLIVPESAGFDTDEQRTAGLGKYHSRFAGPAEKR